MQVKVGRPKPDASTDCVHARSLKPTVLKRVVVLSPDNALLEGSVEVKLLIRFFFSALSSISSTFCCDYSSARFFSYPIHVISLTHLFWQL